MNLTFLLLSSSANHLLFSLFVLGFLWNNHVYATPATTPTPSTSTPICRSRFTSMDESNSIDDWPVCEVCMSDSEIVRPGCRIDLTMDYRFVLPCLAPFRQHFSSPFQSIRAFYIFLFCNRILPLSCEHNRLTHFPILSSSQIARHQSDSTTVPTSPSAKSRGRPNTGRSCGPCSLIQTNLRQPR